MKQKYFIMTDERCGGTTLCSLFGCCTLTVMHDPQIRTYKREELGGYKGSTKTQELLEHCYKALDFDLVKCCYVSFNEDQYKGLLDYCINNKVIIIVLHRSDIYARSLSLEIARNLKEYDKLDPNRNYPSFSIHIDQYKNNITKYNHMYKSMIAYLINRKYEYRVIDFENLYTDKSSILSLFEKLKLTLTNEERFNDLFNKDYNTNRKLKLVNNLSEVRGVKM